ncbi:hypothetical protein BDF21DRAFT_464718 [Thamnidium elegans]|nr:hypothetical protein BDF21DRAFT_464718 [Thamnidium elegans]
MSPTKTINCYKVLGLEKNTATITDVKKAYRKLALQFHPDKQPQNATDKEKQNANEAFQNLGVAYAVLSDPKRKERYDQTGRIEEGEFEGNKDWNAYFKELWTGVVTAETIEAQKLKYQGSNEEEEDIIKAYKKFKGNMDKMLQVIECSSPIDGERFEKLIRKAIKEKTVTQLKHFETTTTAEAHEKRMKVEQKAEASFKAKKNKEDSSDSLMELIKQRSKERHTNMNNIINSIEASAKETEGKGKKRKQEADSMPTEEEFLKLQQSMFKKSKKN